VRVAAEHRSGATSPAAGDFAGYGFNNTNSQAYNSSGAGTGTHTSTHAGSFGIGEKRTADAPIGESNTRLWRRLVPRQHGLGPRVM
jgi:hypothetical protein